MDFQLFEETDAFYWWFIYKIDGEFRLSWLIVIHDAQLQNLPNNGVAVITNLLSVGLLGRVPSQSRHSPVTDLSQCRYELVTNLVGRWRSVCGRTEKNPLRGGWVGLFTTRQCVLHNYPNWTEQFGNAGWVVLGVMVTQHVYLLNYYCFISIIIFTVKTHTSLMAWPQNTYTSPNYIGRAQLQLIPDHI